MIADNTLLTQPEGHQIMDQTRYQWNTNTSDDSRSVVPDTEQNLAPSIFDDVRSDDNELYIVWSDPSLPLQRVASASGIETPPSSTDPAVTTISVAAAATSSIMHPLAAKSTHSASASSSASGAVLVLGEAAAQSMHSKAATTPCDPISVSTSCERFVNRRWSVGEGDHAIEQERTKDAMSRDPMLKQHTCDDVSPLTLSTAGPVESSAALNSPKRVLKSTSRTENAQEVVMTGTSTQSRDQGNRVIMAATVEKLVEKLTSEIDYTFLTDFFLIYRLFITPMALLNLFILRFQWALIDDSPQRQIVRIRTFVTLRHWLLNYFGFDFMRSKKLRQALNVHLRALSKHPLVIDSPRDGRIVMELRRYAQSLKKIHYRTIAQKKQERQNRRQEEQRSRQLQSRKIPIVGREASSAEWSAVSSSEFAFHQPQFSSGPSSAMAQDVTDQHSVVSETMTEVLTVEFHSSDQSDDVYDDDAGEDSEMEDSEDDFELSSDSNSFYTSDDGSEYSTPADEEHTQEGYRTHGDGQEARTRGGFTSGSESDSDYHASYKYASRRETASMNECHLPSPTFSPPAHKDGSGVSIQSQRQTRSAISSTASRLQSRPTLPDFAQLGQSQATSFGLPNSKERHNVGRHRWSVNKAAQPQPLSPIHVATSPPSHGLPSLTTQSSLRSIEPYINPPPRPIAFSEKKKIWTRYMNATVGRLSKMKNAFSSNANKKRRHSHSSSSILSGGSKRTGSGTSQTRPRYWYGNRSDPEGEKLSHYLLRSCTGMNLLLSSSEDRRISIDRRLAAERDQQREEAGSDWSSDDDYSQYEMTRQSSRQLHSQGGQEAEQGAIEPQALETRLEQAQYPPYVDLTSFTDTSLIADAGGGLERDFCVECERERLFSKPCHPLQMVSPITTNRDMIAYDGRYGPETPLAAEPDGGRKDAFPSEVDPSTPTRTHQVPFERHDLDHRDSWMSFSSASMSATDHTASGPKSPMSQDQTRSDAVEQHSGDPQASSHGHDPLQTASRVEPSSADHGSDPSGSTVHVSSPRRVLLLDSKRRTLPPIPLGQQYHQYYRHYYTATPAGMTRDEQFHTLRILHRRYSSGMQAMEDWGQMKVTLKESCALPLVLRYRSELIAQQMCLIERELLNQIQWYEMVDAGWTKKVNSSTGARSNNKESQNRGRRATMGDITAEISATRAAHNMMREGDSVTGGQANWIRNETVECSAGTAAPTPGAERCRGSGDGMNRRQSVSKRDESLGIKRLVERFNLTCQWVACEIVKTRDLEMRVKVVEKFIRIAHTCYNHSNFSSLIQVMLGLQALSVSRLSQTWSRVRAQEMNIMHDLIEFTLPFHNWKHLREAMKNIADEWGGSSSRGAGASCSSTPVSPVSEKPQSSGTGFFSRRSSKSMATMGVKATKEAFRRPSTTTIFDENNTTVTTPTTFIPATSHLSSSPFQSSSSKRRGTWSSGMPLMPTASVSTSGKGKDKKDKETEKSGQQGGCIPFLGLYLSDLVFNSELPSYVDPAGYSSSSTSTSTSTPAHQIPEHRRLVNMHKHRTTATIIKRVLTFRTMASRYPFLPEPEVQRLLRNIQGADADDMLRRSKLCEERATNSAR
ncbi:hypothetical protein EDD11_007296 [Mortierella claussenii]|nr:hypothetical protein EDD11_007296 [Mortierella claussenii]